MQKRALAVAAIVFAGLLAWVWHLEDAPAPTEDQPSTRLLPDLAVGDVVALTIGPEGKGTDLRQVDGAWSVGPSGRPAELAVAQLAVRALTTTESLRRLDGPPSPEYGLGPGALDLKITRSDGGEHSLQLGDAVPVGNGRYVDVDGAVHVADSAALSVFERDPLDFRDRRMLPLDRDAIDRIHLRPADDDSVALLREGGVWRVEGDPAWRADAAAVDELLRDLVGLTAISYGGDGAPLEHAVALEAGGAGATLSIGPMDGTGQRTAYALGELLPPGVGREAARVVAPFLDSLPDDWRSQKLTALDPTDVDALEWSVGGEVRTLERTDGGWLSPDAPEAPVDGAAVTAFLAEVLSAEIAEFAPEESGDGAVEVARLDLGLGDDGLRLEVLRGPNTDLVRSSVDPGLFEISAETREILARLRSFAPAAP